MDYAENVIELRWNCDKNYIQKPFSTTYETHAEK